MYVIAREGEPFEELRRQRLAKARRARAEAARRGAPGEALVQPGLRARVGDRNARRRLNGPGRVSLAAAPALRAGRGECKILAFDLTEGNPGRPR